MACCPFQSHVKLSPEEALHRGPPQAYSMRGFRTYPLLAHRIGRP